MQKEANLSYGLATVMRGKSKALFWSPESQRTYLEFWLCHSDARQVYDLPSTALLFLRVSDPRSETAIFGRLFGKSKTCRASAWPSHREKASPIFKMIWTGAQASRLRSHSATETVALQSGKGARESTQTTSNSPSPDCSTA